MNIAAAWYVLTSPQQQPWTAFGRQMIYRWSSAWYVHRTWFVLCLQDLWDCGYWTAGLFLQTVVALPSIDNCLVPLLLLQLVYVTISLLYTHVQTKYLMPMAPRLIVMTCWTVYNIIERYCWFEEPYQDHFTPKSCIWNSTDPGHSGHLGITSAPRNEL